MQTILKKPRPIVIITTLVLLNLLMKGFYLSSNSLAGDEPFSVYHAQMDVLSIIHLLSEGNNPPLYEIFLHFWIHLFGISEFAVRLPSLIFSSITLIYIYKIGRDFLNSRIALYSSLIFIFSNYHILFAHEARVYSLLGLLTTMSMYVFMGLLKHCCNRKITLPHAKNELRLKILALIIVNTLLIYAHYFGFFVLFLQFLFFISNRHRITTYWRGLLLVTSALILTYIPNIPTFLNRFFQSSQEGTWVEPPDGIESIYNLLCQICNAPVVTVCVISILIFSFVKYIITKKRNGQNRPFFQLVFLWSLFILFFMYVMSFSIPMFIDRYLMPSAVGFCLLLGIALDYIFSTTKYIYLIPIVNIILLMATVKPNITNKRSVYEMVKYIKEIKDTNTLLIICPTDFLLNFCYYYNQDVFKEYNTESIYLNIQKSLESNNIKGVYHIDELEHSGWNNIIYLDAAANFQYPNNNIIDRLDGNYHLENKSHFKDIFNVYEYSKD